MIQCPHCLTFVDVLVTLPTFDGSARCFDCHGFGGYEAIDIAGVPFNPAEPGEDDDEV